MLFHNNPTLEFYKNADSVKADAENKNAYVLSTQYEKLQNILEKYQTIEKNNQWKKIDIDAENFKDLNPMDSASSIKQIRERLFIVGDLKKDSKSNSTTKLLMYSVLLLYDYKKLIV